MIPTLFAIQKIEDAQILGKDKEGNFVVASMQQNRTTIEELDKQIGTLDNQISLLQYRRANIEDLKQKLIYMEKAGILKEVESVI